MDSPRIWVYLQVIIKKYYQNSIYSVGPASRGLPFKKPINPSLKLMLMSMFSMFLKGTPLDVRL